MDLQTIVGMLRGRIESLAADLVPGGRRQGSEYVGLNPVRGDARAGSFKIHLDGDRAGVWADWADGSREARGDALDLIAYIKTNGDKSLALQWARRWLGVDNADPAELERERARVADESKRRRANAEHEERKRVDRARSTWLNASPHVIHTPVEIYLAERGINLKLLERPPAAIRFQPALRHPALGQETFPCMVTAMHSRKGLVACHRTYLERDQAGAWRHLGHTRRGQDIAGKTIHGKPRGSCIRLWRGASGKPLAEAPDGETVTICEGIEDGLTIVMARPNLRVLVAGSVNYIAEIDLPRQVGTVVLAIDNDPPKGKDGKPHPTVGQIQRAIDAFHSQGREVRIARPPRGKDFNAMLEDAETSAA